MKRLSLAIFVILSAVPLLAQTPKGALATLIESGDRKAALERIRTASVADINEPQPDGSRPIHWAIYHVDYELLSALIAKKATLNVRNDFGSTPIAEAAELGDARMVKMLLDAGAEPEGVNADGQTALMLAIKTGETAVVELLIKAGANVNTIEKFHKQTPLDVGRLRAAKRGSNDEAASLQRRRLQAPRHVHRLAQPDYRRAPRAVPPSWWPDRVSLCGA